MRVALVCQPWEEIDSPVERGSTSMAIIAYRLAEHLARTNKVVIYARKGRGQAAVETDARGIEMRRMVVATRRLDQLLDRLSGIAAPSHPFFASELHGIAYWRKVAASLAADRFDVIHVFTFLQHIRRIRRLAPGARIALHMEADWLSQLDHQWVADRLRDVDAVIGCSDFITKRVAARFPELGARCHTVYNGVDTGHFSMRQGPHAEPDPSSGRIVFVARVSPEKGVHVLLDAFRRVLQRRPRARLDIVGAAGPMIALPYSYNVAISEDPLVQALARFYGNSVVDKVRRQLLPVAPSYFDDLKACIRNGLSDNVFVRGQLAHGDLLDVYREADVFAFPSVWEEPFGMPIVEAMACGVPVVATRGGGIPEIVEEGVTGLLVERGDHRALGEAILRLLDDADLRRSMGLRGRQRAAEQFTWERAGEALARIYERRSATDAC
jgi:glycosyltransferase involved in cell wall biosynthesis